MTKIVQGLDTYNFDLFAILVLGHLCCALSVQISRFDFVLELAKLGALGADLLNLSRVLLFLHFHASHLAGEVLLKGWHVNLA